MEVKDVFHHFSRGYYVERTGLGRKLRVIMALANYQKFNGLKQQAHPNYIRFISDNVIFFASIIKHNLAKKKGKSNALKLLFDLF
jgi:hypothetical protein